MTESLIGQTVPDIEFTCTRAKTKSFRDWRGQFLLVYFYPKDNTSGCTREAEEFRDNYSEFQKRNIHILGVSRDSIRSHQKFIEKLQLQFDLISDSNEALCQHFQVIVNKKMYGKIVRGIERSTFLIDPNGILQNQWRAVKVPGHALQVLKSIDAKANSN